MRLNEQYYITVEKLIDKKQIIGIPLAIYSQGVIWTSRCYVNCKHTNLKLAFPQGNNTVV